MEAAAPESSVAQQSAQTDVRALVELQNVCAALYEAREQNLREKITQYPQHVNRASSIGHPCERYLYYVRVDWDKRAPYDTRLQGIFDLGNLLEPHIVQEVQLASQRIGFRFLGQQQAFVDETANLSGHIDGFIIHLQTNVKYPVEIKTCSPFVFDKIGCVADLINAKAHYLRSYYDQLQSYLFMTAQQFGVICLASKTTWELKFLPVELDFAYYDSVLKKCERINAAVALKQPPERNIDFDLCSECSFKAICFDGATLQLPKFDSERLINAVIQKEMNESASKSFDEAKDIIKQECERAGGEVFEAGPFIVKRTFVNSKTGGYWKNTVKRKDELK